MKRSKIDAAIERFIDIAFGFFLVTASALFLALVIGFSSTARADSIYLGGWSEHRYQYTDDGERYNESHHMVILQHGGYYAGYFRNSYGDDSAVVAKRWKSSAFGDFELNLNYGLVYGYDRCEVCPVVIPELVYTNYRLQPVVTVIGNAVVVGLRVQL